MGQSILSVPASVLKSIAGDCGTPVYVYDAGSIRQRYEELDHALGELPHRIHYSVKANSNLSVLRLLQHVGAGADIVSGGELERVLRAGFDPDDIVFSGVGKTRSELESALHHGVGLINVESRAELELLAAISEASDVTTRYGIRINPDVSTETHPYTQTGERGMKFGVPLDEVVDLVRWGLTRSHLSLVGLGMHIGSQITDLRHYQEGCDKLVRVVSAVRNLGIETVETMGLGGGFGIRYVDEQPVDAVALARLVRPFVRELGLALSLEPGRFIVGNAGYLLTQCVRLKPVGDIDYVVVDAGMNDFLRPSLYGAEHEVLVVGDNEAHRRRRYNIVGPVCETGDFLCFDRELPDIEPGTLLAVSGAGAYGFTMSSTYNSRPRPPETLVDGDTWMLIRRRETIDDLMRGEEIEEGVASSI